nr:hypothetical protein [Tanacetum cinerariifolium]
EVATDVVPPTPTSPSHHLLVEGLENDKAAQQLEIVKLKARVKKLEKINKVKSSKLRRLKKVGTSQRVESSDDIENVFNQGRIIADMDQDEGIELVVDQEKDAKVEGRHADKQAELYNLDLDQSSKVLSMKEDDTEVQEAVEIVTTAKLMTEVVTVAQVVAASTPIPAAKPKILNITAAHAVPTRRRKGVVIRDPEEELLFDTPTETPKVKDKGKGILIEALKPMKKKDQIELDADINETPAQKAAKRRKLHEQAKEDEDLKKQLEVVDDEDDDVFIEATPIGRKRRSGGFMENYESQFSTSKPTNFSDDYLLSTLKTMFEKTDGQDAIWRNQQSVYGQALVKS